MLTIVEGSKRVGKSSLINIMRRTSNASVIYNRGILNEMVNIKQESYISALAMLDVIKSIGNKTDIILDRFHLSEYVYGKYCRGYENDKMFSVIDNELSKMQNVTLILVTSDYTYMKDKPIQLTEGEFANYMMIQDKFAQAYSRSNIKNKIKIKLEDVIDEEHTGTINYKVQPKMCDVQEVYMAQKGNTFK